MLKAHKSSPHGTRLCPVSLSVRKRVVHRVCVRYANGDADSSPVEQPAEPTDFVPYAPPQYPAQYYHTAPQVAPPPTAPPASSGTPFWVWILLGVALHWVYTKVQEFRKNPMAAIAGMMGGAKPGVGGAGGGDMAQMMEMMQRMQQQQQQQQSRAPGATGAYPFNGMASNATTINTTASDVVPPTSPQPRSGSKFEENKKSSSNGGASSTASSQPDVKPQSTSSFFSDTQTSEPASQPSFFQDTSSNATQQTGTSATDAAASEAMVENMLLMVADNKHLREQLGMHLPESMNNDATWKWIKENPEIRKQMAKQISPTLAAQFGDMSMFNQYTNTPSNEELMNQMKSMGVDPSVMMSKVMADPEVMQIMTKPHVAQALMEMQTNPASAMKYMSDPDVFKLMQKIVEMNPALKNASNMPPPPST